MLTLKSNDMASQEWDDVFNPKNHAEVTDKLITELVLKGFVKNRAEITDLRKAKELGAVYNTKRNSIIFFSFDELFF